MIQDIVQNNAHSTEMTGASEPLLTRAPAWVWDIVAYLPAVAAAPVLATGLAGLAGAGPRSLQRRPWLAALATAGGIAVLAKWQFDRFFAEQPSYELESSVNGIEIRRYAPRIVAETLVEDVPDVDDARSEGFRRLAGYIFGSNTRKQKIAMTAPVVVRAAKEQSETIAMTAPVTVGGSSFGHVVTFTMPKKYTLGSLPTPHDARVTLRQAPGERFAVLRFSGSYEGWRTRRMQAELLHRARQSGLETRGEPMFAGYDAPSTLPFLRRVEVWVAIA
jgi:hypothetical protein